MGSHAACGAIAVGHFGQVSQTGRVELRHERFEEFVRARARASGELPRTRTQASMNAPASQGQTVP